MKRNIIFLLALCMLLITCSDSNDPIKEIEKPTVEKKDPFITLKKSNIDFTNEGGSEAILIESNVTWTTKSSAGWCTVTPSSGNKSTGSITIAVTENKDYDNRSCTVTITAGSLSKTITVNQGENLGLLVTQDRYELSNEESTIKVEVKANVEFDVVINDEWITRLETRGLTTSEIEFKIAENETYGNRDGSITIKQKGGSMTSTITIFQSQEDALILSEKDFDISSKAQAVELEVKTNIDYEIIIPEDAKYWVSHATTRALRTETVELNIAENKDYEERTVEVIVKDKKTDLEEIVTIKQAANTGIIVSEDKYELSNDGGTFNVKVKANVEFDIEISDKWITRIETRGLTETKLQFQVPKNQDYDNREGTITIKQKGGNLSSTIKVYQSQKDVIILSDKTFDLSSKSQSIDVELKTNVEFELIIPEAAKSWVSYTPTRGLRIENLTLNISENKDYSGRSTEIYVKDKKTNLQDTLIINQSANIAMASLTTSNVKEITQTTALAGGSIIDDGGASVSSRGICWSTTPIPTIDNTRSYNGTGTGVFLYFLTGLNPGTTYYVRAYATNLAGTSYGNEQSFTTDISVPVISTSSISSITSITATGGGNITSDGGKPVTSRGVCWSTMPNPTIDLTTKTTDGDGIGLYSSYISGLTENTKYYVRAYSVNDIGVSYGMPSEFTTKKSEYEVEYNDQMEYANLITEGVTMSFNLSSSSDIDWFKIYVPAGKMLNYKFEVPEGVNGLWRMVIYNSKMIQGNVHNWSKTESNSYPIKKTDNYYFKIFVNEDLKFLHNSNYVKITVTLSDLY